MFLDIFLSYFESSRYVYMTYLYRESDAYIKLVGYDTRTI